MAEKAFNIKLNGAQLVEEQLKKIANSSKFAGTSIADLEEELQRLENELKATTDATKRLQLGTKIQEIEKTRESISKLSEALAIGTDTVEGLEVSITALNASLANIDDPLQRAEVDKLIANIRSEVILLEAEAKKGIFPPGSIGALSAELEGLEEQLKRLPVGSSEFTAAKTRVDELNRSLETLKLTGVQQRQVFIDLGSKLIGAFATGAAALSAFGAENEDVNKAILKLQQSLALVESLRSVAEIAQLAGQAKLIASNTALAASQTVVTGATAASVPATVAATGATTALGTAINFALGPIGLIVLAVGAAVTAFTLFRKTAEDVSKEIEKQNEVSDKIKDTLVSYNEAVNNLNVAQAKAKGLDADLVESGGKLRIEKLKLFATNAQLAKAEEDLAKLKEKVGNSTNEKDKELISKQIERLNELKIAQLNTQAEIIKSTEEYYDKLTDFVNAPLQKYKEEQEALKKQQDEYKAYYNNLLDQQLKAFIAEKDLEIQKLSVKDDVASQIEIVNLELQKQLETFRVQELKGEKVLAAEKELVRLKSEQAITKILNDERKKRTEIANAAQDEDKANADKRENDVKAAIKSQEDIRLKGIKSSIEAQNREAENYLGIINDTKKTFDSQEAALNEYTKIKTNIIFQNEEIALSNKDLTEQEIANIKANTQEQLLALNKQRGAIQLNIDSYKKLGKIFGVTTQEGVEKGLQGISDVSAALKNIGGPIANLGATILDNFSNIFESIVDGSKLTFKEIATAALNVAGALNDTINQLAQQSINNQLAQIDNQNAIIDEQLETNNERLSELDEAADERQNRIAELNKSLEGAESSRRQQILNAIANESKAEKKAAEERANIQEQNKKFEEEKIALEEKARQLKNEAAKKDKNAKIIQSVINTALGATAALQAGPIVGPILAALAIGLGTAQTAIIASQPVPEFEKGGFTGNGINATDSKGKKIAGVVHPNEYVVPASIVQSPRFQPVIADLERARTRGFETGGFTSSNVDTDIKELANAAIALAERPVIVQVSDIESSMQRVQKTVKAATL